MANMNRYAFGFNRQVSAARRKVAQLDGESGCSFDPLADASFCALPAVATAGSAARVRSSAMPIQAMYSEPTTNMILTSAGISLKISPTPSAPAAVWHRPPNTMPATANAPARRPPDKALASTNAMSMPGKAITPNTIKR